MQTIVVTQITSTTGCFTNIVAHEPSDDTPRAARDSSAVVAITRLNTRKPMRLVEIASEATSLTTDNESDSDIDLDGRLKLST